MKRKIRDEAERKWQARKHRNASAVSRSERARVVVFRSARHIYAQVIDDVHKKTLTAISDKALAKEGEKQPDKKARAKKVGAAIAKQCLEKGIDKVVFDRAGYKYHGRVSALADGAREAGLKF